MTADTRTRVGEELEQRVLPWWQEHGVDHEYGVCSPGSTMPGDG